MSTRHSARYLASALLLAAAPLASAAAQIEAGRVIDDSTSAPLVGSRIILQRDTAGTWKTVETTHTDAQGLFQLGPYPPGIYRIALLGKSDPTYFGAVDTLAADSMQQREFRLPITRRSAASAYLPGEVDHQAEAVGVASSPPPDPSSIHVPTPPTELRVTFVVEADGTVDISTFRTVSITNESTIDALRQSLMSKRFRPATIGGIPVRQVVEQTLRTETRIMRRSGGR